MTVAGESRIQGNIHKGFVRLHDALQRPADAQLLTVLMEGRSSSATEHSAQVINGYSDFVGEVPQRQELSPLPAENEFNVVDNVALLPAHSCCPRHRCCLVSRSHDLLQQLDDRLFNHEWLANHPSHNLLE